MKSEQLEPGDLAIIIKSIDGLSIGKIVECVRLDGFHSQYGPIWLVQSQSSDLVSEFGGVGQNVHVAQDWLRKIPKDPLPEEEDVFSLDDSLVT